MASAVASNVHAGPATAGAMSFGWLGPRLSFGGRDAAAAVVEVVEEPVAAVAEPAAISKDFIDFEFSLGGAATMLPADELFADGKLLPLRPPQVVVAAGKAAAVAAAVVADLERERRDTALVAEIPPSTPERVKAVHPAAAEAALDPYVFSPKAPTCSSRWRELLRLRKVQTPQKPSSSAFASSPSASPAPAPAAATPSRASTSSAAARSLKLLLLQRSNGGRASADLSAAPLLRDSSDSEASLSLASSRFSMSSSSSSSAHDHDDFPRHSLDSVDPTPRPRLRLVRSSPRAAPAQPHPPAAASATVSTPARAGHSPARRRLSTTQPPPPPQPSVVSVDSPRMNASGKIVFQGLERSSSSPAGSVHSSMRSRSRVMDRSYSAGVRPATPVVLNVPVCSRPVFGFFKDKKDTAAKDGASGRPRSALGRRTTATPAALGGASCRDLGNGN